LIGTARTGTVRIVSEHPNAHVLRRFYAAFGEPDLDALGACVTSDLVWHLPGSSPISGHWRGLSGLLNGIREIAMTLGAGRNGFELLHVFADDDCAISIHRDFYTGADNQFDLRYLVYARMSGGRIAEVWEVPFDQAENDRYYAVQAAQLARLGREAPLAS
jgi:ketosteroid isomerase-like protein